MMGKLGHTHVCIVILQTCSCSVLFIRIHNILASWVADYFKIKRLVKRPENWKKNSNPQHPNIDWDVLVTNFVCISIIITTSVHD